MTVINSMRLIVKNAYSRIMYLAHGIRNSHTVLSEGRKSRNVIKLWVRDNDGSEGQ